MIDITFIIYFVNIFTKFYSKKMFSFFSFVCVLEIDGSNIRDKLRSEYIILLL